MEQSYGTRGVVVAQANDAASAMVRLAEEVSALLSDLRAEHLKSVRIEQLSHTLVEVGGRYQGTALVHYVYNT